ncbi:MAG: heat-inducible transcription repressor HrcA [Firmicutes bacterium]|nr:heat-inducible transcription repressor HrcA [Bacillota bacterium]MBQ4371007.1 heat-inducible transcription repressor HrcA [Bacillota bacterium]
MELSERKLKILQAVIADFISTAEPVGSRTLSKNHDMGLSPATIRNEMSDLEDMGYLTHPHASAGRVPSDKAYRLYVDKLMNTGDLPEEMKRRITEELESGEAPDAVAKKAAEILSDTTNLISFAITPSGRESKLQYVNVLPVADQTVVIMVVTDDGKVNNTAVRLTCDYTNENLELMSKVMTHNLKGKTVNDILTMNIVQTLETDLRSLSALPQSVIPSFMQTLKKMLDSNLYMDGYSKVFNLPEYSDVDRAREILSLVEKKEHLTNVLVNRDEGLVITIGDENSDDMKDMALITADYKVNGRLVGKLGVLGPKRMRYGEISSVIKYLTDNINRSFEITDDGPEEKEQEE